MSDEHTKYGKPGLALTVFTWEDWHSFDRQTQGIRIASSPPYSIMFSDLGCLFNTLCKPRCIASKYTETHGTDASQKYVTVFSSETNGTKCHGRKVGSICSSRD